jgi:hypothetical protein
MTDGGEDPIIECSNCDADAFILETLSCACCGYESSPYRCIACFDEMTEEFYNRDGGRCALCVDARASGRNADRQRPPKR